MSEARVCKIPIETPVSTLGPLLVNEAFPTYTVPCCSAERRLSGSELPMQKPSAMQSPRSLTLIEIFSVNEVRSPSNQPCAGWGDASFQSAPSKWLHAVLLAPVDVEPLTVYEDPLPINKYMEKLKSSGVPGSE